MNRNCENCSATYRTGKDYGDFWCKYPSATIEGEKVTYEFKGLCEFCNKNSKWYGNDTSYSITTAKQMTQSMPISKEKITYLTTNELENLYKIK